MAQQSYFNILDNTRQTVDVQVKVKTVGCTGCPLDGKSHKFLKPEKRVTGKKVMVWGTSPSVEDAESRSLFRSGDTVGRWIRKGLGLASLDLNDVDRAVVVRCQPGGKVSDEVARHCQVFNRQDLEANAGEASVHVIFGDRAAQSLLRGEYRKDRPIFFSEKLKAFVVTLDNPISLNYTPRPDKIDVFKRRMKAVAPLSRRKSRFAVLYNQDYHLIGSAKEAKSVLKKLRRYCINNSERASLDIEEDKVKTRNGFKSVLLMVGISVKPGQAYVFPLDHPETEMSPREIRRVKRLLKVFIEDPKVKKTFHHGSSDGHGFLKSEGIKLRGYDFDTNYSCYLDDPEQKQYGLDALSTKYYPEFAEYKHVIKPFFVEGAKRLRFSKIPLKVLWRYNAGDADIGKRLEVKTKKHAGPLLRAYTLAAFTVDKMQRTGPLLDAKYLEEVLVARIPPKLRAINKELQLISGNPNINLNSTPELQRVLYDTLRLPDVSGKRSTDKEVLKVLERHKRGRFAGLVMEKRRLDKIEGTYIDGFKRSAAAHGGQIRTKWWLTGAATGRMRAGGGGEKDDTIVNMQNLHGDPLMQNLMISTTLWWEMLKYRASGLWKKAARFFAALPLFLACDYSQIELRVLAEMSGDPALVRAFQEGIDLHCMVGKEIMGFDPEVVKKDKKVRRGVKAISFGIVYGLGPEGLHADMVAAGLPVSLDDVKEILRKYFKRYNKVEQFINDMKAFVERHGYVDTLFGFRRPIWAGDDEFDERGTFWGNRSVNTPIQGTAHTFLLIAMALLHLKADKYDKLNKILAEIHDSLVFWSTLENVSDAMQQLKRLMEKDVPEYAKEQFGVNLKVPLLAEASIGYRFGTMLPEEEGLTPELLAAPHKFLQRLDAYCIDTEKKIDEKWPLPKAA